MRSPRLAAASLGLPVILGVLAAAAAAQPAPLPPRPKLDTATVQSAALVGLEDLRDVEIDDTGGTLVMKRVDAAGPWHALGVRAGDVLVAFAGDRLASKDEVRTRAFAMRYADVTYVEVLRRRKPLVLRRVVEGAPPAPVPAGGAAAVDPDLAAELDRLIVHKGGTTWEIDADPLFADPMRHVRGARVVPSIKDGKPNGFKLYAVRPSSIYARLGFQNGDTITAINGQDVSGMDKAMEVYQDVRKADKIVVDIVRRGKPVQHTYLRRKAAAPKP